MSGKYIPKPGDRIVEVKKVKVERPKPWVNSQILNWDEFGGDIREEIVLEEY